MQSFAAAWLQPAGSMKLHYETSSSYHKSYFQGIENKYTRNYKQTYIEYGLNHTTTLTSKYLNGSHGFESDSNRSKNVLFEVSIRKAVKFKKASLLLFPIKPLWKIISPDTPRRSTHSSFDIGLGHHTQNKTNYTILQFSTSEKIETTHKNPVSIFTEIESIYQKYDNTHQSFKIIFKTTLSYRGFDLEYETLKERFWDNAINNTSLWFIKAGIPIHKNVKFIIKSGHERTLLDIPRENFSTLGIEINFPSLP